MPQTGFLKAMLDYFGLRPGQTTLQFGAEIKVLSFEEKLDFANGLRGNGINCADPEQPKTAA